MALAGVASADPTQINTPAELQTELGDGNASLSGTTVKLLKDVTLSNEFLIDCDDVTLDLNGYVLTAAPNSRIATVNKSKKLTIIDSNGNNGEYYFKFNSTEAWTEYTKNNPAAPGITVVDLKDFNSTEARDVPDGTYYVKISGGIITGGNTPSGVTGGAFYIKNAGTFVFTKGNIVGCHSGKNGGAIWASSDGSSEEHKVRVILSGGNIIGCTADGNGGAILFWLVSIDMNAGSIVGCSAKGIFPNLPGNGGAIQGTGSPTPSTINLTGSALISDCAAKGTGGGMLCGAILLMKDNALIQRCVAEANAGGVYVSGRSRLMDNAAILDCIAGGSGGGLYTQYDPALDVTLSDSVKISGCIAGTNGGGVYVASNNNNFNVSGDVHICDNKKSDNTPNNLYLDSFYKTNILKLVGQFNGKIGIVNPTAVANAKFGEYISGSGADNFVSDGSGYMGKINVSDLVWTPINYSVEFNTNGGTGTMAKQDFTYDEAPKALTANSFTRIGYNFAGWNTEADLSGIDYADGALVQNLSMVNGSIVTMYANWTVYSKENPTTSGLATFNDNANVVKIVAIQNASTAVTAVNITYEPSAAAPSSDGSYTRTALTPVINITLTGNLGSDTANIVFNLTTAELNGASPSTIYLAHKKNGAWEYLKPSYTQTGDVYAFTVTGVSSFSPFVPISMAALPPQYTPSSSSRETGKTIILTATPTPVPTTMPTPTGQPTIVPGNIPTQQQTQKSPAPVFGIIAGLGAAAVLLRLRK